jgi:hypothetical protein
MQTYRTAAIGDASAVEWIATGLSWIDAVVGFAVQGTASSTTAPNFVLNAQGTGVTEGTNPGDLGIENVASGPDVIEVTVIGRP